jgi:hypothetical protein
MLEQAKWQIASRSSAQNRQIRKTETTSLEKRKIVEQIGAAERICQSQEHYD